MSSSGSTALAKIAKGVLCVDTEAALDDVLRQSVNVARVRIHVPNFTDGRVFSLVRALVEAPNFHGLIEVHGDLLPDQVPLLERYGVHAIELENGINIEDRPRYITGAWRERRLGSGPGDIPTYKELNDDVRNTVPDAGPR